MVTEKNSGSSHDFLKDPIRLLVEGDWLTADGTTLGADNGIGVAAALTLLDREMRPRSAASSLQPTVKRWSGSCLERQLDSRALMVECLPAAHLSIEVCVLTLKIVPVVVLRSWWPYSARGRFLALPFALNSSSGPLASRSSLMHVEIYLARMVDVFARQPLFLRNWLQITAMSHVAHAALTLPHFSRGLLAYSAGVLGREATPAGVPLHRGGRDRTGGRVQSGREHGERTNDAKPGECRKRCKNTHPLDRYSATSMLHTKTDRHPLGQVSVISFRRRPSRDWHSSCRGVFGPGGVLSCVAYGKGASTPRRRRGSIVRHSENFRSAACSSKDDPPLVGGEVFPPAFSPSNALEAPHPAVLHQSQLGVTPVPTSHRSPSAGTTTADFLQQYLTMEHARVSGTVTERLSWYPPGYACLTLPAGGVYD